MRHSVSREWTQVDQRTQTNFADIGAHFPCVCSQLPTGLKKLPGGAWKIVYLQALGPACAAWRGAHELHL
ncbi:hypothetical protein PUN4_150067 [Paraburkholderia unamae]|nr:hypothetical protein PUN4_150067 [Paraburkholderia unamae]